MSRRNEAARNVGRDRSVSLVASGVFLVAHDGYGINDILIGHSKSSKEGNTESRIRNQLATRFDLQSKLTPDGGVLPPMHGSCWARNCAKFAQFSLNRSWKIASITGVDV